MNERTVFFLSDQTGVTAETLGHSLLMQFDGHNFRQVTLPFIDNEDKAREAVEKINEAATNADARPIVFSTLVQDEIRAVVRDANGLHLDIFDVFLEPLEEESGVALFVQAVVFQLSLEPLVELALERVAEHRLLGALFAPQVSLEEEGLPARRTV